MSWSNEPSKPGLYVVKEPDSKILSIRHLDQMRSGKWVQWDISSMFRLDLKEPLAIGWNPPNGTRYLGPIPEDDR